MMLCTNILSALSLLLATAWCVGAASGVLRGKSGVSVSDIKLSYEHTVARYANWKPKPAKSASRATDGVLFEESKLASLSNAASAIAVVRKRGTVLPLHAVGGYPKMLGVTYNAEVGMGTPTQRFNLTADTGSTLTWAVLASCKDSECPGASTKRKFDPAASTTNRPGRKDHEAYGDGEMDVTLYGDVVDLGGIKIDATVGGATKTFERDGKLEHDGLLGLGRKVDADPAPVLDSLAKKNRRFQETIALDLGAQPTLEVGGYNYIKYPNLNRYTVSGDEGWQLEGGSITTKAADKLGAINLLLDTGSSVSMLPASRLDAMMKRAGVEVQRSKDEPIVYSMACDTKLGVQLVLPDGTQVAVDDSAILMRSNDANMPGCLSLLVGTTNPFVPAVAGTPLLQSLYTVLSRTPRGDWIGLAPL